MPVRCVLITRKTRQTFHRNLCMFKPMLNAGGRLVIRSCEKVKQVDVVWDFLVIGDDFEVCFKSLSTFLKELICMWKVVTVCLGVGWQLWDGATLVFWVVSKLLMQLFEIIEASLDTVLFLGRVQVADPVLCFYFVKCRRARPGLLSMETRNSDDNFVLGHRDPSVAQIVWELSRRAQLRLVEVWQYKTILLLDDLGIELSKLVFCKIRMLLTRVDFRINLSADTC